MERLTKEQVESVFNNKMFLLPRIAGKKMSAKILNELLEYKVIEKEFGLDIPTIFLALMDGVWLKNGDKLEHHFVFLCKWQGKWALGYEYSTKYGIQGWVLELAKYKKHWAIWKEDLEDENAN